MQSNIFSIILPTDSVWLWSTVNPSDLIKSKHSFVVMEWLYILEIILTTGVAKFTESLLKGLFSKVEANILKFALILWDNAVNFFLRFFFVKMSIRNLDFILLILFCFISEENF